MNTWNSGSWTITASFCYSFSSIVSVPFPLPYLNLYKAPCKRMVPRILLFTIDAQTFHMTSINPINIYPPPPLGMRTIVIHANASGMYPSWNDTFIIITIFPTSQCMVIYTWLPPLAMSSGVLLSYPIVILPVLYISFALQMQSPLLLGYRL